MKYKTIFDMDYLKEERNPPDGIDPNDAKFSKLLRALNTDFMSPAPSELQAASQEEIDRLMRILREKRRKFTFPHRWLYGGLAASLIAACAVMFSVSSLRTGRGDFPDVRHLTDAVRHRNTQALFDIAVKMKKGAPAKSSSLPDYRTVMSAASYLAGMQNNQTILKKIAEEDPAFAADLLSGATRGTATPRTRLPEIADVRPETPDKLQKHQYPLWGDYVAAYYPGLPLPQFRPLAARINRALLDLDSVELADCAISLSACPDVKPMPEYFSAKTLFDMAWDIAAAEYDPALMTKIAEMYRKSPLYDRKTAANLLAEIKYVSKTGKDADDTAAVDSFKQLQIWSRRNEK